MLWTALDRDMLPFGICLVSARVPEDYMFTFEVSIRVLRDLLGQVAMAGPAWRQGYCNCLPVATIYTLYLLPAAPWCLGAHHLIACAHTKMAY